MPNDTTVNSTAVNDLDNSFVTIKVTGLRQNKNLRRGFSTFKVSHSNLSETMRRINRMGGKIVDVTFSSQYDSQREEVDTSFVGTDLAINFYLDQAHKYEQKIETQVTSTETKTEVIEEVEVQNTEVQTEVTPVAEVQTEVTPVAEVQTEVTPVAEIQTEVTEVAEIQEVIEENINESVTNEITETTEEKSEHKTSDDKGKKAPIHKHKKGWKSKRK